MSKVLILGGAFDPPHYGHYSIARRALDHMAVDGFNGLWFMPCSSDAFGIKNLSSAEHRVNMLELLLNALPDPRMLINTFELDWPQTIGTYAVMKKLMAAYPEKEFRYVIGTDQAESIRQWRNSRELRKLIPFVTVLRRFAGLKRYKGLQWCDKAPHIYISKLPNDEHPISSTAIREAVASGAKDKKFLLDKTHSNVLQYIEEHNLYKGE